MAINATVPVQSADKSDVAATRQTVTAMVSLSDAAIDVQRGRPAPEQTQADLDRFRIRLPAGPAERSDFAKFTNPPTFGSHPKMVRAIIAGGARALRYAVEGAEDSSAAGARDLSRARISKHDIVVGISASGTTPYVLGALKFASRRGARTIGITSNPGILPRGQAQIAIAPETGPEAIAGSTRLKAGTAQKMSTSELAFQRRDGAHGQGLRRQLDGRNVALTNSKLRRRGVRILEESNGRRRLLGGTHPAPIRLRFAGCAWSC